jgi:hypothetical protein
VACLGPLGYVGGIDRGLVESRVSLAVKDKIARVKGQDGLHALDDGLEIVLVDRIVEVFVERLALEASDVEGAPKLGTAGNVLGALGGDDVAEFLP